MSIIFPKPGKLWSCQHLSPPQSLGFGTFPTFIQHSMNSPSLGSRAAVFPDTSYGFLTISVQEEGSQALKLQGSCYVSKDQDLAGYFYLLTCLDSKGSGYYCTTLSASPISSFFILGFKWLVSFRLHRTHLPSLILVLRPGPAPALVGAFWMLWPHFGLLEPWPLPVLPQGSPSIALSFCHWSVSNFKFRKAKITYCPYESLKKPR